MMKHIYDSCEPSRSIPVLEIHGTLDDVTLVEGDVDNSEGWGAYMPLNDTIAFWVSHNGLSESEVTDIADTYVGWLYRALSSILFTFKQHRSVAL